MKRRSIVSALLLALVFAAGASGQDSVQKETKEEDSKTVFRDPFSLKLHVDAEHFYEGKFKKVPYVHNNDVYLFKGESFGVAFDIKEGEISEVSYVKDSKNADVTFKFSQEIDKDKNGSMMMLVIKNQTKRKIFFDALMTMPGKEGIHKTSILPLEAGLSNYESWPHPIIQLVLQNIRLKEGTDSGAAARLERGQKQKQERKLKFRLTILALSICLCPQVFGKAVFFKRSKLITEAVAIAVIEIKELRNPDAAEQKDFPAPAKIQGETWAYSQEGKVNTVRLISGDLPDEFLLYGEENFICASCTLTEGKYLAFLGKDKKYWVGLNWHFSLRPIKDGKVEWYDSEEEWQSMTYQPLDKVITEIEEVVSEHRKNEPQRAKSGAGGTGEG